MGIDIAQQQAYSPSKLFRYKRVCILFAKFANTEFRILVLHTLLHTYRYNILGRENRFPLKGGDIKCSLRRSYEKE